MNSGPAIRVPKHHAIRIEQNGPEIVVLLDGRLVFRAEWREAMRVAEGMLGACLRAKKEAEAAARAIQS